MKEFGKRAIALLLVLIFMVGMIPTAAFATDVEAVEEIHDHVWSDWELAAEPTCAEEGSYERVCLECGEVETKPIPVLDHTWDEGIVTAEPTCTEEGICEYTCLVCGETASEVIPTLDHTWDDGIVLEEPTCTEEGVVEYTCLVCGETVSEPIPALDHTWGEWYTAVEPTCTEDGVQEQACSACGETVSEPIPALGHTWGEWVVTAEPTCTEDGIQEQACSVCGETVSEPIPALGHTWGEWVVTQEPTCTEDGIQEQTCSVCGETVSEAIPALGHTLGEWIVTKEPTCIEEGTQEQVCSACGETVVEAIPASGHALGEWVITKEPTCTEEGTQEQVCSLCGETVVEAIPALGHTLGEWVVTKEPTCTEEGTQEQVCSVCGETVSEAIPALGHDWDEWVVSKEPACEEKGEKKHVCKVCGEEETEEIEAKGHDWTEDNGADLVKCKDCGLLKLIADGGSFDLEFDGDSWIIAGDPDADVEGPAYWDSMFQGVTLSGVWADDLVTIAQTQVGYHESTANYAMSTHSVRNGYTRYGAWYGIPYGDWCAMFISFCMNYAGISSGDMPYDAGCPHWIETLNSIGRFGANGSYDPKPGDLVFYDDGDGLSDHVGIIHWIDRDNAVIHTIEGNVYDSVSYNEVYRYSDAIVGYGMLPENPGQAAETVIERVQKTLDKTVEGKTVTVSGLLPEDAELSVVAIPLETANEIFNTQMGEDAAAQEVVVAYDVSIISNGQKYDLEEYGDSVSVSISNVDAEDLSVTHVKIDVTDGNGGLDESALNEAMTVKQESETLNVTSEGGEVFFDLSSCSIVVVSTSNVAAFGAGPNIDVAVNVNWTDDDLVPESLANRPSQVSFTVESTTDGITWTEVAGSYTVSGDTSTNTWSNTWSLPGTDEEGHALTYRVTENGGDLNTEAEHERYPAAPRYTVPAAQTTEGTSTLNFTNECNWPWPLIDKADSLYQGSSAVEKLHTNADGPSLTENGPEAAGPFEANTELYYKIHYTLDSAENWTRPDPYSSSAPFFDEYSNVKLMITLPAGLLLKEAGGKNWSAVPSGQDLENIDVPHTYTIEIGDSFDALNATQGSFNIRVYIGNNGTENSVKDYLLDDSLVLSADWQLVDRTNLPTQEGYKTGVWYNQEQVEDMNDVHTTTPDVWGMKKSLVGDHGVVNPTAKTVTFTWKVDVGLKDGDNLITTVADYKRNGADAVTITLSEELLNQHFVPAVGSPEDLTAASFKIYKGATPSENESDWSDCPASVRIWPEDPNHSGLVMDSGLVLDKNGDGTADTYTPRYTTYYVKAVYNIRDDMIGDFTSLINRIESTNKASTSALLANARPEYDLDPNPQTDSMSVYADAPLFLNEPAKVKITKYLVTVVDGSESTIEYTSESEKYAQYGPLDYTLTDAAGNPVHIYKIQGNAYVEIDTATEPLVTGELYYVTPGTAYKVQETIPTSHANDMTPVVASATSDHTLAAGETWTAELTNKETRGELIVIKTDDQTPPRNLKGATFKLVGTTAGSTYEKEMTTGDSGTVTFRDLPYGNYTLEELTPPPGYVSLPNQFPDTTIVIDADHRSVTRTYKNTETKATIELNKHVGTTQATISDSWPLATSTDAGYFTFVLQRTKAATPSEADWEPAKDIYGQDVTVSLTNGAFSVQVPSSEGSDTYKYRFVETISPDSTSGVYLYYPADMPDDHSAASDPVTLTAGGSETVHMYNRKLFRLLLNKNYYEISDTGGTTQLTGSQYVASFQLYKYVGTGVPTADQLTAVGSPKSAGSTTALRAVWNEMPLYDNGQPVQYFLKETSGLDGFVWTPTNNQAGTTTDCPAGYLRIDPTQFSGTTWQTTQRNYRNVFPVRFAKKNSYTGRSDISGFTVTIYTDAACTQVATNPKTGQPLPPVTLPVVTSSSQTLRYSGSVFLEPGRKYYYQENVQANYSFVGATSDGDTTPPARGGVIDLTGRTPPYSGTTRKDYVVTNKPDPSLTINKKNAVSRNTNVSGAQFTVYVKDTTTGAYVTYPVGGDPMVIDKTNESSGKFLPATLPTGYDGYYFSESTVPANYLNPNTEAACAEYNRLDPPEAGQDNKYIWDATTGKTFVKGVVTEGQTATFTFYNVPNTGSVKVVKLVDGAPATEKGFPVEIQNAEGTAVKSGSTGSGSNPVNAVTLTGIPIYDANGNKIEYTVKESALTGTLANTYYFVSDGQKFKLEPGQTVDKDDSSDPQTLTINNATYIKVTGTKFKFDTWQHAHGGFVEKMGNVDIGLYRRAMVKNGDTWVPYGDGTWSYVETATTGSDGIVNFDKLIRGEKIDDTEVSYEYALVELDSNDPNYFPFINGKVKEDGYPAEGAALSNDDLFGQNAKYNALPLSISNIVPVGGQNAYTTDGKAYSLGDMLNGNHWVQFDITKWLDSRTLQENIDQHITPIDSEGHRTAESVVPSEGDTTLDECIFSLYRCILPDGEGPATIAFSRSDPWVCIGTYTSGHLEIETGAEDADGNPITEAKPGEFLTAIDTNVNQNYVYVLVEESTGPSGAILNPHFKYTVYALRDVTVTGIGEYRKGTYNVDAQTKDNILNSKKVSPGTNEIYLTSLRLAKWRDSYDDQGNRKQVYEPLSNAVFKLYLAATGEEIAQLITGLDGGARLATAQSGTYRLQENPDDPEHEGQTLEGAYLIEYEVEGGIPRYYRVGDSLEKLKLNNPANNGYTVYGVPVNLLEDRAPSGYGFSPMTYQTYLIFVDTTPDEAVNGIYTTISDLYYVTDTQKPPTTPLAESQTSPHWHVTCDSGYTTVWAAFGDSAQLRIVDYPMVNTSVEVHKVGYEVNSVTMLKDSETIATSNYGAIPLPGVTMALERYDETSTAANKWRPWDYNADNYGSSEVTFTTEPNTGTFFFLHGLPMGTYRIYEKSLGGWADTYENAFDKSAEHYRQFVVGGVPEVIYMANPRKMELSLTKKDIVTGADLTGWTFKLGSKTAEYDSENKVYTFKDLTTGSYTLSETAPSGAAYSTKYFAQWFKKNYADLLTADGKLKVGFTLATITSGDGQDVTVNAVAPWNTESGTIAQLEIKNPPLTNFNLKKVDLETNDPLEAHFFVFYKPFDKLEDYEVTLPTIADGTSNRNVRTTFTSAGWTDTKPSGDYTVGTGGLSFNNQEPGIYVFYENVAPTGYGRLIKDGNVVLYSAVITGGLPVNVTVNPSSVTVGETVVTTNFTSTDGTAVTITAKDPKKAPLKAQKIATYGELAEDEIGNWSVTLDVYDAPTGGNKIGTVTINKGTTDVVSFKNPSSLTNDAYFNVGQDYYLEETVISTEPGYADAAHFPIISVKLLKQGENGIEEQVITLNGNDTRYKFTVDTREGFTIQVTDQYLYGYVNFWKLDDDLEGRPGLSGASFKVLKTPDNPDDPNNVVPGSSVEEIGDTGRYHAYIPLLSADETSYYIYETEAPDDYVITDPRYFEVRLSAENNVEDYTVTGNPPQEFKPATDQAGKQYLPNTLGKKLTVLKYNCLPNTDPPVPAGQRYATFTVYQKTGTNQETGEAIWRIVDRYDTDDQGKVTYLMEPNQTYAVAETWFDVNKSNGLEGFYINGVKQTTEKIIDPGTQEEVEVVTFIDVKTPIELKAYNVPIYNPVIAKIDVGQYPEGVRPNMDFKVYEVDASFVATPETVKGLVDDASKVPVFSGRTGDDFSLTEGEGEQAVTYIGTQKVWEANEIAGRWDHTKRYVLVETEIGAAGTSTYNTMVKDDPRVVWYLLVDPIEDPSKDLNPWVLRNINGVADVTLVKDFVEHSVNETSDVENGKVESLLEGKRTVVYTVTPSVTGSNQKLQSFVLEDFGLTSKPAGATFDYKITELQVGGATHRGDSTIYAKVTFNDGTVREVAVPADITQSASVVVPDGAKSFKVEYYSPTVKNETHYSETTTTDPTTGDSTTVVTGYTLGEEFRVGTTTFTVEVARTPDGNPALGTTATEITEFTNDSKVTLSYPIWDAKGNGPTYDPKTAEDDATVLVKGLELPIVSIDKAHTGITPGQPIQTGSILHYVVTVENTASPAVDFENPVVLDILPTGVTFLRSDEQPVTVTGGDNMRLVSAVFKTGKATQKITVPTPDGSTEQVWGDAETAVIFTLEGTLHPGTSMTIDFSVRVGASAVLYETADGTLIENEAYLSSSKHTYHTEDNPQGYSFMVGDDTFGEDLATTAAGVNPGSGDPAELHEQGVHDYLGKDTEQQTYIDQNDYVWVAAKDTLAVVRGSDLTLSKAVQGDQDDGFLESGIGTATRTVKPATATHNEHVGSVKWRLSVNNGYDFPANYLMIGDVIPKVGDTTNQRSSQWDVNFDNLEVVKANGVELVNGTDYVFYYYTGATSGAQAALNAALRPGTGLRSGPVEGWTEGIPADAETKEQITAFALVFDQTPDNPDTAEVEGVHLKPGSSLIVTYHTLVKAYNDDTDFNENRAFKNADNVFYLISDDPNPLWSNVVSVTLLDSLVSVEGDVWIDEDWDALQQSTGNRRDYSQYAIVNALKNNIGFSLVDGRSVANEEVRDDFVVGTNENPGYGESVLHFVFENLGPAVYMEGRTLYGTNNYLNAGKFKVDALGALKGSDPFHYWLYANLSSGAPLDSIDLTDLGANHYKSDDPVTELTATALQSLDSNFYPAAEGSTTSFMTHPFYVRYSDNVDQSKDIGFRGYRGLIINKVADDDHTETLEGVKFSIYGPYEDTTINDPATGAPFPAKTPAYGYSGDGLLKFTLTNGVYVLDPNGQTTELVTDANGQIQVSGLNWWKEYEIVETETITPYSIEGSVIPDQSVCTQILDEGNGKFMLMVPAPGKTAEMGPDNVTVTNKRGLDFKFRKLSAEVTVNGDGVDVITTPSPLEGATFGLFTDEACTTPFMRGGQAVTATSDSDGWVAFTLLPYGTYYMKETGGVSGYWLNTSIYKVEVLPKTSTKDAHVEVTLVSGPGSETEPDVYGNTGILKQVTDEQGHVLYQYEILNLKVKVKAQLIKIDEFEQTKKLADAQFGLFTDADCTGTPLMTVTTDANGEASFGWLEPGTYYMKETVPPTGYPLSATVYELTITYSSTDNTVTVTFNGDEVTLDNGKATFSVTVTNSPAPATLQIPVKKVLDGEQPAQGVTLSFDFELTPQDGAPMPKDDNGQPKDKDTVTVIWPDPGTGKFAEIEFKQAGTYVYTVKEVIPDPVDPHVAYHRTPYTVTVTVAYGTGEDAGKLFATYDSEPPADADGNLVFTNTYTPDPVKLVIPVKKVLDEEIATAPTAASLANASFTFTIEAHSDTPNAPLPTPATVDVKPNETKYFDVIEYTKAGVYKYTVTETAGSNPHYTPLDPTTWNITVTVEDTADKKLKVTGYVITDGTTTVTATSDQLPHSDLPENLCTPTTPELAVVFTNPYTPDPVKLVIPVKKEIRNTTGTAPDNDAKFTFTIAADESTPNAPLPNPTTTTVIGATTGAFGEIEYTKAGTYKYTVTETACDNTHYDPLDPTIWNIEVTVTNTEADVLKVTGYVITDGKTTVTATSAQLPHSDPPENLCTPTTSELAVVFKNPYTPEPVKLVIPVEKEVTLTPESGTAPLTIPNFKFTIAADDGTPMPKDGNTVSVIVDPATRKGSGSFSEITYTAAGEYTYTVIEEKEDVTYPAYTYDQTEWEVYVKVENKGDTLMVTQYRTTKISKDPNVADVVTWAASGELEHVTVGEGKDRYKLCTPKTPKLAVGFDNPYTPAPVRLVIPVEKKITYTTGTAPVSNAKFTFTIAADDGTPMPTPATVTITGADKGAFSEITYTKAGTYKYTVTETACDNTHYNPLDPTTWSIEVTVENTADDILKVTSYKVNGTEAADQLTHKTIGEGKNRYNLCTVPEALAVVFTNPYTPDPVKLKIPVEKKINNTTGTAPVSNAQFTFTIAADETTPDAPLPKDASGTVKDTVVITGADTGVFDEIEYTKAGVYKYTVTETACDNTHYDPLDSTTWNIEVTVTNTEADVLKVTGYVITDGKTTVTATSAQLPHSDLPENLCTPTTPELAVVFENPYTPDPVKLVIPVEKKIPTETAPVTDETFTFTITAADGTPLPNPATVTITGAGTGTFGQIEYTKADTYTYTVKEIKPENSNDHYTYSEEEWTVVVTVENTADDVLKVTGYETKAKNSGETKTATSADLPHSAMPENVCTVAEALGAIIFDNPYTPDPVKLVIPVEKKIPTDSAPVTGETFTFTIEAADGAPLPNPATTTVTGEGTGAFGQIEYTKAGTYTYTVKETRGSNKHYEYSTEEWTVKVTVENTADDVLKVTGYETKAKNSGETKTATSADLPHSAMPENVCTVAEALGAIIFNNPYTPDPVKLPIEVEKNFRSYTSTKLPDTTFYFDLKAKGNAPLPNPATVTVTGSGTASFGEITFTKSGTYEYTVTERAGTEPGVTYDTRPRTVVVTVTVNANDELEAHYAWSIAPAAPSAATKDEPVEVTNTYEVGRLIIKKTVSGNRGSRTFAFPFKVEFWDAQGKEIKDTFKFTGSRTGLIKSGQTVRLRHGEYIVIEGIPAGTTYRVTETNSAYHRVTSTGEIGKILAGKTVTASFLNYRSTVPKTGETNLLPVTIPAMGVSGLGMILSALFGKKRKSRKSK